MAHTGLSEWERRQRAAAREAERQAREAERSRVAAEKERQRRYVESRHAQAGQKTAELTQVVDALESLLRRGLNRSARIDLRALRKRVSVPPLDLGALATPVARPNWDDFAPRTPGAISRAFGGQSRYERELAVARDAFERCVRMQDAREIERQQQVVQAREKHAQRVKKAEERVAVHNRTVDDLIARYQQRDHAAVEDYLGRVLGAAPLPAGFPRNAEVTFNPKAEHVIVRVELPPRDVVPAARLVQYQPRKDEDRITNRPVKEIAELYRSVVSQVALLCMRDLLDADPALATVGFNGHVHAINPATGQREYPCLVSLNVDRADFPMDTLGSVQAVACVRHLKAIVSNHPYELEPIEPIIDFDLSKYSFVEGLDAVATLDSRPDLMEMSPTNFEHLVRQIFEAQGAEGWTTEQSHDDGVDAVIVKRTPLMGGLSIVQAKRYNKVVGVSHIRELAGAMEEKKAGWGVLVTTSWFTSGCWDKAREHGRMELIDGERLVYLVKEHLGKDVIIGIKRPRPKTS